jgi:PH (Pleckstrin Homology) domain-containing protein
MTTYKSKPGPELIIPLSAVLLGGLILAAGSRNWVGTVILFLAMAFMLHVFLNTYYEINGDNLKIRCGFLIDRDININEIVSVRETHNPLSAPATSIDRLELKLSGKDSVLISPKDKIGFINHLKRIKPTIGVIMRKKK